MFRVPGGNPMRKVVEVIYPALHEQIVATAHSGHVKVNLLATLLLAYAMEHLPDVLHDAERLIGEWESRTPNSTPMLRVIRGVRSD